MKGRTRTHVTETLWDRVVKWCRPWACGYLALRWPYGMSNGVPRSVSLSLTEGHFSVTLLYAWCFARSSVPQTPRVTPLRLRYRTYVRFCIRMRGV